MIDSRSVTVTAGAVSAATHPNSDALTAQPDEGLRPPYIATGGGAVGTLPYMKFQDETIPYVVLKADSSSSPGSIIWTQGLTCVFYMNNLAPSAIDLIFNCDFNQSGYLQINKNTNGIAMAWSDGQIPAGFINYNSMTGFISGWHVYAVRVTSSRVFSFWRDGVKLHEQQSQGSSYPVSAGTNAGCRNMRIGAANSYDDLSAQMVHFALFNKSFADSELETLTPALYDTMYKVV